MTYLSQRRKKRRSERGATLVEAAIASIIVMFLIFGVLEFGLAFKDYLAMSAGARDSVRVASTMGTSSNTDFLVLQSIKKRMVALDLNLIEDIVIYKAASPNSSVPAACKTSSVSGSCNHYTKADLDLTVDKFTGMGSAPDRFWAPSARKDKIAGTGGPPDYVGLYVKINHQSLTGFITLSSFYEDDVVMRIEPATLA